MKLQISPDEHRERLAALQRLVKKSDLDAYLVSSFDSIYYLTGAGFEPLERPFFLLARPAGIPILLVPKLDQKHMRKAHAISPESIETYWEYPAPAERSWPGRLRDLLGRDREIGVEPSLRMEIADQLRGFNVRVEPLVDRLRIVKSPMEIRMIRRAARYADFGVERLLSASYRGSTVAEGFAETRTVTSKIIREVDNWDPLMSRVLMATWAAPFSAIPHSVPELRQRLVDGPHVALVLTRVNGYSAESERTYFTTPPSKEARAAFGAMMEARRLAFDLIRPGLLCSELDATINECLRKKGYEGEERRLHRTGHGIGLGTHEAPWVAEGSDDQLAENMVISVEPGIYSEGFGGIRHSDTVLITKDGHERLTRYPTQLDSLVVRAWKPITRLKGSLVRRSLRLTGRRA